MEYIREFRLLSQDIRETKKYFKRMCNDDLKNSLNYYNCSNLKTLILKTISDRRDKSLKNLLK